MNLSPTLDVALSLIFVFVLAALLASTGNEIVAGALKLRGVYLTKAIESLTSLGKDNSFKWGGVGGWFHAYFGQTTAEVTAAVDNAAIAALAAAKAAAAAAGATAASVAAAVKGVADFNDLAGFGKTIDDAVAAAGATPQSVLDIIRRVAGVAALQKHPLLIGTPSSLPSYVPARDFAAALLGVLSDGSGEAAFARARATIDALPDGDLKTTLLAFIASGADDVDKLRTRIETWFDDAMERLSGIYTRFSQYVMLALGLLIAVTMNIDSVHAAKALWEEPALSKAISDSAARYVANPQNNPLTCSTAGTGGVPACPKADVTSVLDTIEAQTLPIGRKGTGFFGVPESLPATAVVPWEVWTCIGWAVTAVAISLGAQFWFGVLTQLTNLRSAGDKPERAGKTS